MEKGNIFSAAGEKGEETEFIGDVQIKEVLGEDDSNEQKIYHVYFKEGARTKIHQHRSEQILIATDGWGFVAIVDKLDIANGKADLKLRELVKMEKGDAFCVPANVLHLHGAQKDKDFSHISVRATHTLDGQRAGTVWEDELLNQKMDIKDEGTFKESLKVAETNLI